MVKEIFAMDEYNLLINAIYNFKYSSELTQEQEESISVIVEKLGAIS